jgi:hypothetical protein
MQGAGNDLSYGQILLASEQSSAMIDLATSKHTPKMMLNSHQNLLSSWVL